MATRTIKQLGQSWGSVNTSIVASIDGVQVFSGPVSTIDAPPPPPTPENVASTLFSWTVDTSFQGSHVMTVSVSGSPLWLSDTTADYGNQANVAQFDILSYQQVIDGVICTDCMTGVTIDGAPITRGTSPTGQWYWRVGSGQTFQATVNIPPAIDYPLWDPVTAYPANSRAIYGTATYTSSPEPAAAGLIPPDHPETWYTLPCPVWRSDQSYAIYTRVYNSDPPTAVYKAVQNVPAGTDLNNTDFWQMVLP